MCGGYTGIGLSIVAGFKKKKILIPETISVSIGVSACFVLQQQQQKYKKQQKQTKQAGNCASKQANVKTNKTNKTNKTQKDILR